MNSSKSLCFVAGVLLIVAGSIYAQESSTTTEKKEVEIVHVSGNTVIFIMDGETLQQEISPGFRVDVDGQLVPLSNLVPGQKVMLERTTTTTVVPSSKVVTVRDAEVMNVTARTLVYRDGGDNRSVIVPSDFKFKVDGRVVGIDGLRPGMRLTATIIDESAGSSSTVTSLGATSTAPTALAPAHAPAPAAKPAPPARAPAPAPELPKVLPSTASPIPLIGLLGSALVAIGFGVSRIRRRIDS
jgi:hypothetical protein